MYSAIQKGGPKHRTVEIERMTTSAGGNLKKTVTLLDGVEQEATVALLKERLSAERLRPQQGEGLYRTTGGRRASAEPASMKRAIFRAPAGGVQASAGTRWSEAFAPVLHREPHSQAFACWQHSCGGACVC